jgi:hypothetical protein
MYSYTIYKTSQTNFIYSKPDDTWVNKKVLMVNGYRQSIIRYFFNTNFVSFFGTIFDNPRQLELGSQFIQKV